MGRPEICITGVNVEVKPFVLDEKQCLDFAKLLGFKLLDKYRCDELRKLIARGKATEDGSDTTTIVSIKQTLSDVMAKSKKKQKKAIEVIAADRSGIDSLNHKQLQPLAKRALQGDEAELSALKLKVQECLTRISNEYPAKVYTKVEPFRLFCGNIRKFFNEHSHPSMRETEKKGWKNCKKFAREIFQVGDFDTADFDTNPNLLKEYLGTEI